MSRSTQVNPVVENSEAIAMDRIPSFNANVPGHRWPCEVRMSLKTKGQPDLEELESKSRVVLGSSYFYFDLSAKTCPESHIAPRMKFPRKRINLNQPEPFIIELTLSINRRGVQKPFFKISFPLKESSSASISFNL